MLGHGFRVGSIQQSRLILIWSGFVCLLTPIRTTHTCSDPTVSRSYNEVNARLQGSAFLSVGVFAAGLDASAIDFGGKVMRCGRHFSCLQKRHSPSKTRPLQSPAEAAPSMKEGAIRARAWRFKILCRLHASRECQALRFHIEGSRRQNSFPAYTCIRGHPNLKFEQ